jgi:hypothetical protein
MNILDPPPMRHSVTFCVVTRTMRHSRRINQAACDAPAIRIFVNAGKPCDVVTLLRTVTATEPPMLLVEEARPDALDANALQTECRALTSPPIYSPTPSADSL